MAIAADKKRGVQSDYFSFGKKKKGSFFSLNNDENFGFCLTRFFLGGGRQQRLLLFPRLNFGSWESSKSPMDPPPPPQAAGRGVKTKIIRGRVHDTSHDGFFSPFFSVKSTIPATLFGRTSLSQILFSYLPRNTWRLMKRRNFPIFLLFPSRSTSGHQSLSLLGPSKKVGLPFLFSFF